MMNMMDTPTLVSPEELIQWWVELAQDEQSPDNYELTEYGELVLSPRAETNHQRLCAIIAGQLSQQLGGEAPCEVAVLTATAGLRVPDVVWMPQERWNQLSRNAVLQAPELVVEVLSPGNRKPEMNHKIQGYLRSGVQEVIVVGLTGGIEYIRQDGVHTKSMFNLTLTLPPQLFS
ncbi:MAG: Uma2 family endonuclease [Nitrospirales bacterium]|nr:Uma2 family endonuclease [Nitrospirales bacterium]MBA3968339.1 Uma2 family endonuclease [Nitrospirales bacterium]